MAKLKHFLVLLEVDRKTAAADALIYGRLVVQKMTNNKNVSSTSIPLATFTTHLDVLESSHATAQGKAIGTASARDTNLSTVITDLETLRGDVQVACDANPARAAEIAESCGMKLKKTPKRNKAELEASMTATPGMVKLVAKAVKRGATYEWAYSADGGVTWVVAGITNGHADTTIAGLKPGTTYRFRFRTTVGRVTGDWSQAIEFLVH
jgi:uncharacterized protein YciI